METLLLCEGRRTSHCVCFVSVNIVDVQDDGDDDNHALKRKLPPSSPPPPPPPPPLPLPYDGIEADSDRRQVFPRPLVSRANQTDPSGASGSASDRRHALAVFAKAYPSDPVDVIISDYMSEVNMTAGAARKVDSRTQVVTADHGAPLAGAGPGPAYEAPFLEALEPALEDLAKYAIKVVANAGNADTESLYRIVREMIRGKKLDIKVAWISGDEVLPTIQTALQAGTSVFKNIHTNEVLSSWQFMPIYAQAYLGGLGIAEALSQGAQIVICGRVADASPVIGAAVWFHQWQRTQLTELANAFVAGHLIECSCYVTGGNFSGFKSLETTSTAGWVDIGYPIAEISRDGQVVITKQKSSGGAVTVDTCSAQLLYEIQGPWYFNSDVTAVLDQIWFEQLVGGPDRVALHGVQALPPPPTTKVGITARGGFQAEAMYFMTGLDLAAKARMTEAQLRKSLKPYSHKFSLLSFSVLGAPAVDVPGIDIDSQNAATAVFRVFAQARSAADIAPSKFLRPVMDNIMQSYPGGTFHLDYRLGIPKPYFEYYVSLLDQSKIEHVVHLGDDDIGREETILTRITIPPPPLTKVFPDRQPSQPTTALPIDLTKFGPTKRVPLGAIVHARSGDKGSDCNCGFWVSYDGEQYAWLRTLLSVDNIKSLLGKEYTSPARGAGLRPEIEIERFELPNLHAVHFLFRNLLDRGATSTASVDFLGKNCAEFLRARHVDVPLKFLARGKL